MATKSDVPEALQRRKATRNLVILVAVWGTILAIGAFLAWDRTELAQEHAEIEDFITINTRVMKLVITLTVVGLFVGGWSLALFFRHRRILMQETQEDS